MTVVTVVSGINIFLCHQTLFYFHRADKWTDKLSLLKVGQSLGRKGSTVGATIIRTPRVFPCKQVM